MEYTNKPHTAISYADKEPLQVSWMDGVYFVQYIR